MTDELVDVETAPDGGVEAVGEHRPSTVMRAWSVLTGDDAWRPLTIVAWAALFVLAGLCLFDTLTYDFTVHPIVGDQASHVFTTLSMAGPGHNLSYDLRDLQEFNAVNWMPRPYGLYFQRYGEGWAYAKPYGYGVYASPFAWVFGTIRGVALANTFLLFVLAATTTAMLRLRYRGAVVPVTVGAFVFLGMPFFYAYVLHPDLMLATLTSIVFLLVLLHWKTKHVAFAALAAAAAAPLVVENPRDLVVLIPMFLVVIWELRSSWRKILIVVASGVVVIGIVILPNLKYSDGASWNAYAGDRAQAVPSLGADPPFDGVHVTPGDGWRRVHTGENYSTTKFFEGRFDDPDAGARAVAYYFFGRHTGMLLFLPAGFLILLMVLFRVRKLNLHVWSILIGIGVFILIASFVFHKNYYGGGQSLGNRYFLQVCPSLIALAVAAELRVRALASAAIGGAVLSVLFLLPHFKDPSGAYAVGLAKTSWLQRQLPNEQGIAFPGAFREQSKAGQRR